MEVYHYLKVKFKLNSVSIENGPQTVLKQCRLIPYDLVKHTFTPHMMNVLGQNIPRSDARVIKDI